jgi:enoyl-CoA hydratase/carnithine racemase
MAAEVLTDDVAPGVRAITLHRPDELNAWTYSMEHQLFAALDDARRDQQVRVVTITGSGRGFCAGASMAMLTADGMRERPPVAIRRRVTELMHYPKPVIAVLNGATAGIGLALALACDIRFAAESAKLTTAFVRRGLIAEHGTAWLLTRLVGRAHATELLLSGRTLLGTEAARIGLVAAAVPIEDLAAYVAAYTADLVTACSPGSWAVMKAQLTAVDGQDVDRAYLAALPLMDASHAGPDFAEGVQAFRERRDPHFPPLASSDYTSPVAINRTD